VTVGFYYKTNNCHVLSSMSAGYCKTRTNEDLRQTASVSCQIGSVWNYSRLASALARLVGSC